MSCLKRMGCAYCHLVTAAGKDSILWRVTNFFPSLRTDEEKASLYCLLSKTSSPWEDPLEAELRTK